MKESLMDNNASSKADILKKVKEFFYGKTLVELEAMIEGDNKNKLPVIVVLLIGAFVNASKSGTENMDAFLDHVLGDNKAANDKNEERSRDTGK
jgi:hypothetical protein